MTRLYGLAFRLLVFVAAIPALAEAGNVPAPAPEPTTTALLLAAGLGGLGVRAFRRRR